MRYFYPSLHKLHKPSVDLSDGLPGYKHIETPLRVDLVLEGLKSAYDCEVVYVEDFDDEDVRGIHDGDYVDFLLNISKELSGKEEYIPSIFRKNLDTAPIFFRGGMYCDEIGTPIGGGSIKSALNSVRAALEGVDYMLQCNKSAFVLTRPPGHHAKKNRYGGYCFFNNPYICATKFVQHGKKVAVVDIDYHIGDGSMEFATKEMPYYSLNCNIHRNYPYFESGFKNNNSYSTLFEFEVGISGSEYLKYLRDMLCVAIDESIDVVILSLGFDTLGSDYCQDEYIYLQVDDYFEIGREFFKLKQDVLVLLEGGYDLDNLKMCAKNFMLGFSGQTQSSLG